MRLQAGLEQIRHERKLELGERAGHIDGSLSGRIHHTVLLILLVEQPRHTIHG